MSAWLALLLVQAQHAPAAGPDIGLWKLINFVLFAGGIGYFLWKRGGGFFRARTEQILKGIEEATRLRQEAEARYAAAEQRLAALGAGIEGLRAKAREEAAAEEARLREQIQRDMAKIRADAEQEIAAAGKAARQQLRAHSAELAVRLAALKIRRQLSPEVEDRLVSGVVRDLERARPRAS